MARTRAFLGELPAGWQIRTVAVSKGYLAEVGVTRPEGAIPLLASVPPHWHSLQLCLLLHTQPPPHLTCLPPLGNAFLPLLQRPEEA